MAFIHPFFYLAVLLDLAALADFNMGGSEAALLACLAFSAAMAGVKKQATPPQHYAAWLSGILAGLLAAFTPGFSPLFLAAILLGTAASMLRYTFFLTFTLTRFNGLDLGLACASLAAWVTGALTRPAGLVGWLTPLPAVMAGLILGWLHFKYGRENLERASRGYNVEVGKPAPEFSLANQDGKAVKLSDFRGRNVLLIFVRGDWCPSCHVTLRNYERNRERFKEKGVVLLSIGPDPMGVNRQMVEKLGLQFEILSDEGQRTAMAYGVQIDHNRYPFKEGIPLPASFLINTVGAVCYSSRPERVGEFLYPSTIFPALEKLY